MHRRPFEGRHLVSCTNCDIKMQSIAKLYALHSYQQFRFRNANLTSF